MALGNRPPPFHVQSAIDNPSTFAHHQSISALWQKKWRFPCSHGIYPFVDGKVEDLDLIFEKLIADNNDDPSVLYDPDAYAAPFLPVGQALVQQAEEAEGSGDVEKARELFLRAAAVYRIARFPINRSELPQKAWEDGKTAYLRGSRYLDPPNAEVIITFTHADVAAGDEDRAIPAYLRIPNGEKPLGGWPVLLFICGLDAYRTDHTNRTTMHTTAGFATLSLEIPGTGDCPAARNDPESPDRLFSSVIDWITANASTYGFDASKIVARGVSTGGYYAFRIAHTHADRLLASVGQGGWSHYMLQPDWIRAMNHMEYPFALADALAYKFGHNSVEEWIADDPKGKFSLVDNEDSIFPIEDSMLVASRGRVKDVRFMEGKGHMGNPGAEEIIIDWINEVLVESRGEKKTFKA